MERLPQDLFCQTALPADHMVELRFDYDICTKGHEGTDEAGYRTPNDFAFVAINYL